MALAPLLGIMAHGLFVILADLHPLTCKMPPGSIVIHD